MNGLRRVIFGAGCLTEQLPTWTTGGGGVLTLRYTWIFNISSSKVHQNYDLPNQSCSDCHRWFDRPLLRLWPALFIFRWCICKMNAIGWIWVVSKPRHLDWVIVSSHWVFSFYHILSRDRLGMMSWWISSSNDLSGSLWCWGAIEDEHW